MWTTLIIGHIYIDYQLVNATMRTKVRTIVLFLSYFLLQLIALSNIQARRSASVLASEDPNSLLPARTDTQWFHNYIYNKCGVEIEFIKGRLKFGDAKNSAPFPSMVVIFKPCPDPSIKYCRSSSVTTT